MLHAKRTHFDQNGYVFVIRLFLLQLRPFQAKQLNSPACYRLLALQTALLGLLSASPPATGSPSGFRTWVLVLVLGGFLPLFPPRFPRRPGACLLFGVLALVSEAFDLWMGRHPPDGVALSL